MAEEDAAAPQGSLRFKLCEEDRTKYGLPDEALRLDVAAARDLDADTLIDLEDYLDCGMDDWGDLLEDIAAPRSKKMKVLKAFMWLTIRLNGSTVSLQAFNPKLGAAEIDAVEDAPLPPA